MRIFTCTPVAFGGGDDFFARDSGLLCKGFQAIGVDSRAVMPGTRQPEDKSDLIRTEFENLESAHWWRNQHLDGVVLYAWGRPKFRKIAAAIHEAGIYLVLNQDNTGLVSPLAGIRNWFHGQWIDSGQCRDLNSLLCLIKSVLRGLSVGLAYTDPFRARHLKFGNAVSCVSPLAAARYRRLCRIYGGTSLANKITVIPHPVESTFQYNGQNKSRQVVCVGRWDDEIQKRTSLLIEVIASLVANDELVSVVIAGNPSDGLMAWHQSLEPPQRIRVRLIGTAKRNELIEIFSESQVFYSPSSYESFGIAAAEALCCGCSVVAGKLITLPSFEWFVSENSGHLAKLNNCTGHAEALHEELECWANGARNPEQISSVWRDRLHADKVAGMIMDVGF